MSETTPAYTVERRNAQQAYVKLSREEWWFIARGAENVWLGYVLEGDELLNMDLAEARRFRAALNAAIQEAERMEAQS